MPSAKPNAPRRPSLKTRLPPNPKAANQPTPADSAAAAEHSLRIRQGIAKAKAAAAALVAQAAALRIATDGRTELRLASLPKRPFDVGFESLGLLVEIDGGDWLPGGGAHNRASRTDAQRAKSNAAALAGWFLLRVSHRDIQTGRAAQLVADFAAKNHQLKE